MSKEQDFKERFVAVLRDLRDNAETAPEPLFLIGSLASRLIARAERPSWAAYKSNMAPSLYDGLLADFEKEGNAFHQQGKHQHAYAIQVLAVSLIARTQADPEIRAGDRLLDEMIDFYVSSYRAAEKMTARQAN